MSSIGYRIDLTGRRYGRLLVLGFSHTTELRQAKWRCACDCGSEAIVTGNSLKNGKTQSCGCLRAELQSTRSTRHGMSASAEYRIYKGMVNRCYNPKVRAFPYYGGRGISVCDRWRFGEDGKDGFECFLADVGTRPSRGHSLDRSDNDLGYQPSNVAWATSTTQANNSRRNRLVNVADVILTLAEAVRRFSHVTYSTVGRRLRAGWGTEAAILAPDRETESEFNGRSYQL
jgi:hypothetical protein